MDDNTKLYVLWTNDNPVTAENMVFMYSINSMIHGWWEKVTIIVWGATATLICNDTGIQSQIRNALAKGVHIIACKACAEQLKVSETLENLGVEVIYTGELLTEIIKSKKAIITI